MCIYRYLSHNIFFHWLCPYVSATDAWCMDQWHHQSMVMLCCEDVPSLPATHDSGEATLHGHVDLAVCHDLLPNDPLVEKLFSVAAVPLEDNSLKPIRKDFLQSDTPAV